MSTMKIMMLTFFIVAVDDFEFNYDQFSPYMEPSFHLLFKLLTNVESCDSKVRVLSPTQGMTVMVFISKCVHLREKILFDAAASPLKNHEGMVWEYSLVYGCSFVSISA